MAEICEEEKEIFVGWEVTKLRLVPLAIALAITALPDYPIR